jgi:hypothetical protein
VSLGPTCVERSGGVGGRWERRRGRVCTVCGGEVHKKCRQGEEEDGWETHFGRTLCSI